LQEYERFKVAAENLDKIPRLERDFFKVTAETSTLEIERPHPSVDLKEVLLAFKDVLKRVDLQSVITIQREVLSVREKMTQVLSLLEGDRFVDFFKLFDVSEGRLGIVVTFLSILELVRESMIELVQNEVFGSIYVRVPGC
jgi:segregation and condensation protein A